MTLLTKRSLMAIIFLVIFVVSGINCYAADGIANGANIALPIETYLAGKNQCTHPSVITFEEEWNGYKYWMSYTPYPFGNGEEENPCIAVSNDMINWITPANLANPIADNEETACNELKDPHILYNDKTNCIEVWYLGRIGKSLGGDNKTLTVFRKTSADGISWTDYEVMHQYTDGYNGISPSILWTGGEYLMYNIVRDDLYPGGGLKILKSNNGKFTEDCVVVNTNFGDLWHGSVEKINGKYYFVYVGDKENSQYISLSTSDDGINFSQPQKILQNDEWRNVYRPCLSYAQDNYYLYYGVVSKENRWMISCSYGNDLSDLSPVSEAELTNTHNIDIHATSLSKKVDLLFYFLSETIYKKALITGVFAAVAFSIFLLFIKDSSKAKTIFSVIFCVVLLCINSSILMIYNYSITAIVKALITIAILTAFESSFMLFVKSYISSRKKSHTTK